jgi:Protein of unknown function (DUF1453)
MSQTEITVLIAALIVVALGLRILRASREQRIGMASIWVAPAIFLLLTAWVIYADRFTTPLDLILVVLAVIVGGAIGMYQGTHTTVRADRQAKVVYVKTRPLGIAIFVVVIALRLFIRLPAALSAAQNASLGSGGMPMPPKGDLLSAVSVLLLGLALGLVAGLRVYLFQKYSASESPAGG